jgi:hypothetical protein
MMPDFIFLRTKKFKISVRGESNIFLPDRTVILSVFEMSAMVLLGM